MLSVRPNMSTLSTGDVPLARSLFDLDLERDSRRRFLLASRDRERFLLLSQSLDRDLERLPRFLLCLLPPFECFGRDELRLLERPISALAKLTMPTKPSINCSYKDKKKPLQPLLFRKGYFYEQPKTSVMLFFLQCKLVNSSKYGDRAVCASFPEHLAARVLSALFVFLWRRIDERGGVRAVLNICTL